MTTNEHFDRIKDAMECADAGIWDKHYGHGLTIDYTQAVHGELAVAQESLSVLRSQFAFSDSRITELTAELYEEHRARLAEVAALTIERDQARAEVGGYKLYLKSVDAGIEQQAARIASLEAATVAICPNCDSACNPTARACWKCNAWLEAASTPPEDAPALTGSQRGEGSGPLPGRDVTVVQTGEKTLFVVPVAPENESVDDMARRLW